MTGRHDYNVTFLVELHIRIHGIAGKKTDLFEAPNSNIGMIKAKVFAKLGIPLEHQRLVKHSRVLSDTTPCTELIEDRESIIAVVLIVVDETSAR